MGYGRVKLARKQEAGSRVRIASGLLLSEELGVEWSGVEAHQRVLAAAFVAVVFFEMAVFVVDTLLPL